MENFFAKIFGSKNSRELKRLSSIVETISSHEKGFETISDLSYETGRLRKQIEEGRSLNEILPEAFALVRDDPCVIVAGLNGVPIDTYVILLSLAELVKTILDLPIADLLIYSNKRENN